MAHCWYGYVTYEACCGIGELGVGNPACWEDSMYTYEMCCTPPEPPVLFGVPLTYAYEPLRLGEAPPSEELSEPLRPAERAWATGYNVEKYSEEKWRLARDPELLARFRSETSVQIGAACNALGTYDESRSWMVSMVVNSILSRPEGKAMLLQCSRLASSFDNFGSPRVGPFVQVPDGTTCQCSNEFLTTVLWLSIIYNAVRHDGPIDGQNPDGTLGGLPQPEILVETSTPLPWDVVEVGAGWGWMALLWQTVFRVRSYSIVDLPAAEAVQSFVTQSVKSTTAFLSTRLTSYEVLPRYDLFVSLFAFTELDPSVRSHYLEKLVVRSRRGIILDNSHALRRRDDAEGYARGEDWYRHTCGLDLVRILRQMGFTVRVTSLAEAFRAPLPEPVGIGLLISWYNTSEPYPGLYPEVHVEFDWKSVARLMTRNLVHEKGFMEL